MEEYKRKAIFSEIGKHCTLSKPSHFIEITEWINEEGFDVLIDAEAPERISMTYGQWNLLKKMVKELDV